MEGAAQRLRLYSDVGRDIASALRNMAGADTIQGVVTREPTLEEAYLSLIRESARD